MFADGCIGALSATVDSLGIETSSAATGTQKRTGQYGVSRSIPVTRTKQSFAVSASAVVPLELTFTTGANGNGLDNGGISAQIGVVDGSGNTKTVTVNDLTDNLVSGSFRAGEKATVRLQLKDVSDIQYVRVLPSGGADCEWDIASFAAKWVVNGSDHSVSRTVGRTVSGGEGCTINFGTVSILLTARVLNSDGSFVFEKNSKVGCELTLLPGQYVEVNTEVFGSLDGFGCTVSGAKVSGEGTFTVDERDGVFVFTPQTVGNCVYTVTAVSDEDPSVKTTATVTVEALV